MTEGPFQKNVYEVTTVVDPVDVKDYPLDSFFYFYGEGEAKRLWQDAGQKAF